MSNEKNSVDMLAKTINSSFAEKSVNHRSLPELEIGVQEIVWVDSDGQLEELCMSWEKTKLLSVDTEFIRTDTYYPIAGLLQINDGKKNYLIDPLAISDFFPLVSLFDRDDIVIAMHSCSEDLEVFHNTLGSIPKTVMDTQLACAFAGFGFSVGYARAVEMVLGVQIPKEQTRSDWLARPLSEAQLRYAALDVEYLYALSKKLEKLLVEHDRLGWLREDCEQLKQHFKNNQNVDTCYLKIKSAWKLDKKQLLILRALAKWREEQAQIRDIPRNRIIKEHALIEIARRQPTHVSHLRVIEGLTERMIKSFGRKIIDVVEAGSSSEDSIELLPKPLSSEQKRVLKVLRAEIAERAEQYQVPPELLIKKKDYEFLLNKKFADEEIHLPPHMCGWRKEVVGDFLLNRLENFES